MKQTYVARVVRAFPTILKIGFHELVAYRAEVLIWILSTTMPLVMLAMWASIAREAPVGRFDENTFAAYFMVTLIVRQLASSWVVWELNFSIRSGALSGHLMKPIGPLWQFAGTNLGVIPFRAAVLIPVCIIFFFYYPMMHLSLNIQSILLFIVTLFFAWVLLFLIQSIIGTLALYTEQSLAIQEAWFGLWSLLSGYLIPLEIFPFGKAIVQWLPFRYCGSLPTEILIGHLQGKDLQKALLCQAAYILFFLALATWQWNRSLRRFEAYG